MIAKAQVEVALREGATAVAHGCTGKGNDQVRFEHAFQALAPQLKIIAPWREWTIKSREDAIDYAEARNIPITASREKIHSRDRNLWHLSHEGGELEDPANAPLVEVDEAEVIALQILDYERGDQKARDDEKYINADEPSAKIVGEGVERDHR